MTPTADEWSAIVGMLPLIRHIAWRLRGHIGRVVDIEDLVQVGILGAVRGLATHDPALSDLVPHLARSAEGWMRYEAKVNRGPVMVGNCAMGPWYSTARSERFHYDPWKRAGDRIDGRRILTRLRSSTHRGRRVLAAWADGALDIEQAECEGVSKQRVAQLRVDALRRIQGVMR